MMQKLSLGILVLLVIFLAAVNLRLQSQARHLEERLTTAERKTTRTPTAEIVDIDTCPPLVVVPVAAAKASPPPVPATTPVVPGVPLPKRSPGPLHLAGQELTFSLSGDQATLVRVGNDEDLGLTEPQKKAVAELRRNRETQTGAYTDMIQHIEAQTEQMIRQLLTAEQQAKYDAQHPPADGVTTFDPVEEPKTASGLNRGYLGISGSDAEGGGARVTQVLPNTPASAFGLQKDDVILAVNGVPVPHLVGLSEQIKAGGEGIPVVLRIRRGGQDLNQAVQLGALPK